MNSRYFICRTRRKYTDAGYRWAYWQLEETGIVTLGCEIDVNTVLAATGYWKPDESQSNEWLCAEILPTVKNFLEAYHGDGIDYVDEEFPTEQWELGYEWRETHPRNQEGEQ